MTKTLKRRVMLTGHITMEQVADPMKILPPGEEAELCDYLYSCACRGNKLCLKGYSNHCQIKRFYDKWGIDYEK